MTIGGETSAAASSTGTNALAFPPPVRPVSISTTVPVQVSSAISPSILPLDATLPRFEDARVGEGLACVGEIPRGRLSIYQRGVGAPGVA